MCQIPRETIKYSGQYQSHAIGEVKIDNIMSQIIPFRPTKTVKKCSQRHAVFGHSMNHGNITRMDMNMSKKQQPYLVTNVSSSHPWVFKERRGNPHTTGQTAAGSKTVYHTWILPRLVKPQICMFSEMDITIYLQRINSSPNSKMYRMVLDSGQGPRSSSVRSQPVANANNKIYKTLLPLI